MGLSLKCIDILNEPMLLNELRVGVIQRDTQYSPAGTPMGVDADVYIAGVGIIGYNLYIGSTSTERSTEVVDNMTWTRGHSTVKFGTDLEHTTFDIYSSLMREYIFASLAQYQATLAGKSTYNKDTETNGRPLLMGRNSIAGPSTMQEDAQLQRNFAFRERYHGSVFIETENLLNSTNAACDTTTGCSSAVNNDWGTGTTHLPTFGQIISARTSRNVQTGLKFSF
jgi:hypothetical protein